VSGKLLSIDEILKLHKNLKAMSILCNHFLPCVVRKMMEMQIQAGKKVNDIATVSDEAFALLISKHMGRHDRD